MRVLYLTYAFPVPPVDGGRIRQAGFVRALSRVHDVDLLSFTDESVPPDRDALEACRSIRLVERRSLGTSRTPLFRALRSLKRRISRVPTLGGTYSAPMAKAVTELLAREPYDLVVADSLYMGRYLVGASVKKILDLSDLLSGAVERERITATSVLRRGLLDVHRRRLAEVELHLGRAYDLVLLPTAEEAGLLRQRLGAATVRVLPNAFDCSVYPAEPEPPSEPASTLFCGSMDYYPNLDAVRWLAHEIFPRIRRAVPGSKLLVVGKNPPREIRALASEQIEVTGFVADTRPYFRRAAITVAPMRLGGGTRVKILEAMAAGRPVVATSFGASGLAAAHGREIVIADEPESFAQAVVRLLRDRPERERLARAARSLVESTYDTEVVGRAFVAVCEEAAEPHAAPRR